MSEMEEKLGAILNNPQMMQQILSMAQAMSASQSKPTEELREKPPEQPALLPNLDPGLLRQISGLASGAHVDQQQKALLNALQPYLSRSRVHKLERAMRAAKLAGAASAFLNAGGLQLLTGR